MPTINIDKKDLFDYLDNKYDTDTFRELCFEFGIELEDDTSEDGSLADGERAQLKIDIPANRYDLLCFEGLSRALGIFLGTESTPHYRVIEPSKRHQITVTKDCSRVRPYVVGLVLRDIEFTPDRYQSFIELQDKLHRNLCRNRTLVSVGTHDLDTVKGPFTYEAQKPEDIQFVPLNQTKSMNGREVVEFYEGDMHIRKFVPIIKDSPVYPVVYDADRTVMSLPPLINSEHSKITLDTRNVFIEITATDMTKVNMVLNIMMTMFSCYCKEKFTAEPVDVVYPDGQRLTYPDLEPRVVQTTAKYLNGIVGIQQTNQQIVALLKKMSLAARVVDAEKGVLEVKLPATRPDMLQECDVAEDLAIAFGYNKIPRAQNNEATVGKPLPLNKLAGVVRKEIALAGWTEALTLSLCSHDENFKYLRRTDNGNEAVVLANPKTIEYQICRSMLLPGLLKTVRENRKHPIPFKLFEVSDVIFKNPDKEQGAQNERRACALFSGRSAQFEVIQGLLDTVMQSLDIRHASSTQGYVLEESPIDMYLPGRSARVVYIDEKKERHELGSIGVLHPEVLTNFELDYPVSSFEINIEHFL